MQIFWLERPEQSVDCASTCRLKSLAVLEISVTISELSESTASV